MQFKRWRLSAASPLVNAGLGLALLFSVSACGGGNKATDEKSEPRAQVGNDTVELPAVWATSPLDGAVQDIAIAGGIGGTLAIAYERGGLQLFTLEGDRMTDSVDLQINALGRGITTVVDDAALTIFPGIDQYGTLKAYLFGDGFNVPAATDLPIVEIANIEGLCVDPLPFGAGGLFKLAYWAGDDTSTLKTGVVSVVSGDFEWAAGEPAQFDEGITACAFVEGEPRPVQDSLDAVQFKRGDFEMLIAAHSEGEGMLVAPDGEQSRMTVRDGITVRAPAQIDAVAAYGTPLSGGYPRGVIVIAGETAKGEHQAVFVDPTVLTDGE